MTELEKLLKPYYDKRLTLGVIGDIAEEVERNYWLIPKTEEEKNESS